MLTLLKLRLFEGYRTWYVNWVHLTAGTAWIAMGTFMWQLPSVPRSLAYSHFLLGLVFLCLAAAELAQSRHRRLAVALRLVSLCLIPLAFLALYLGRPDLPSY